MIVCPRSHTSDPTSIGSAYASRPLLGNDRSIEAERCEGLLGQQIASGAYLMSRVA